MKEYSLEHIYPDFAQIIKKSLEFSENLLLFLPRNTSISELIDQLLEIDFENPELILEIEELQYGHYAKALLVSTGNLVKIHPREVTDYFVS